MRKNFKGFTLIELLIVIAVLGILAVAVLAAINPIEQINRSRDTGTQSDAEQLIGAIDRFYANQGYYPWQSGSTDHTDFPALTQITNAAPAVTGLAGCTMLDVVGVGNSAVAGCSGAQEVKASYTDKITKVDSGGAPVNNPLYIYFDGYDAGKEGNSYYICFDPASGSFQTAATTRCDSSMPDDLPAAVVCNITLNGETTSLSCLP